MDIQIINQKSKQLRAVQDLGDTASNTVGFLPREAYIDYARKENIIVVTENEQLLAYTMFRFKKSSIWYYINRAIRCSDFCGTKHRKYLFFG